MDAELDGPRGKRRLGLAAVVVLLVTLGWLRVDRLREGHAVSPPLPETEDPSRLQELGLGKTELEKAKHLLFDPGISVEKEGRIASDCRGVSAMHDVTEGGLATALEELSAAGGRRPGLPAPGRRPGCGSRS